MILTRSFRPLVADMRPFQSSQPAMVGRTTPRRVHRDSHQPIHYQSEGDVMKTIAIRLDDDLHAQITLVAQLNESTITEEIRSAITDRITEAVKNGDLGQRAEAALAEIDDAAEKRKAAIGQLLQSTPTPAKRTARRTSTKGDK